MNIAEQIKAEKSITKKALLIIKAQKQVGMMAIPLNQEDRTGNESNCVFKKYSGVFLAECDEEHNKGDIIELTTKYDKKVECEVYNLIGAKNGKFYYSIVRIDEKSYAQRKADKWESASAKSSAKSNEWYKKSQEGRDFLALGEPIKVGHHSERRHRALIDRNWDRLGNSVKEQDKAEEQARKAEYWRSKEQEITISMPESIEFYQFKLEEAKKRQQGLKDGTIKREHGYSLTYAIKDVKTLTEKYELAKKLWG